ncbi:MAG: ATP-binding protein [Candidatus Magnetoovum sp. WYHC-5]|nr:ATP-binding protein [Candidatus Magnetoovum sp. WYHC-5]
MRNDDKVMLLPEDNILYLMKKNILFQNITEKDDTFTKEELQELAKYIQLKQIGAGITVFREGTIGKSLMLVLQGTVGVYVADNKGDDILIATIQEGSFFGEMAIIHKTVRTATIKTHTDCLLGVIIEEDFWTHFSINQTFSRNLLWGINKRLTSTHLKLVQELIRSRETLLRYNEELEQEVEKKTYQLRQRDMQLLAIDRIVGIGTLAAGIAHEINNPLSIIKSGIGFIRKKLDVLDGESKYDDIVESFDKKIASIDRSINRIEKIIRSMMDFARLDVENSTTVNIGDFINNVINILAMQHSKNIEFITELHETPSILISTSDLTLCLTHVIKNAIDAIENNGRIKITAAYDNNDKEIVLKIIDNGYGMSKDTIDKAFNHFFTTKRVGKEIGMGLPVTESILKGLGGDINIESKEGEGTIVTLVIPVK